MNKQNDLQTVAAREDLVLPLHGTVAYTHAIVAVANASLFNGAFLSVPLTTYSQGWRDPSDLDGLLEFIAPEVQVGRKFEFAKATNAEAFLTDTDDVRAIGADFKRVEYSGETQDSSTQNKGLVVYVDLDRVAGMPDWEQRYTSALMQRLTRNECRRGVSLLSAAANNTNKTFNSESDPDMEILDIIDASGDKAGIEPNRILCGRRAMIKRKKAYRAQNNAGGYASARMTPQELADEFMVDEFRVSRERYQSSDSAKSKIVGDIIIAFNAVKGALPDDPSHIKRFVSSVDGGGRFRVFRQEISAKIVAITVEHYSRIVITYTNGIEKITVQ